MEKFVIKPNAAVLLRQFFLISLILPLIPAVAMTIDMAANRENFRFASYYEPFLYLGGIGLACFLIMTAISIPSLLKEKVFITADNLLIFQPVFKKAISIPIRYIIAADRGYKQTGNGKVQVVKIYSQSQAIAFELKKYAKEDIESLINNLLLTNPKINNLYAQPRSIASELKKYFLK